MRHDILSDVLFVLNNADKIGRRSCIVPASSMIKNVLDVIKNEGYIGGYEFVDDGKSGSFSVQLIGNINKTRSIRPRFSLKKGEYEKWEARYLPAKGFGILIVSTSKGIMSQKDAMKKGLGGQLIGYIY
jgi:small subunit ribosomal protein S8